MIRFSALFFVLFSTNVFARPITVTYEGVASGSLDGAAFTNVAFTIVGNADTGSLEGSGCGQLVVHQSTTVALDGLGEFRFLTDGVQGYGSNRNGTALEFMQFDGNGLGTGLVTLRKAPCVGDDIFNYQTVSSSMDIRFWGDNQFASDVMTDAGRLIFNDDLGNTQGSRTLTYPPPQPIPVMSIYLIFSLAGLLALFVQSRVRFLM